jgi:hypothetical protein
MQKRRHAMDFNTYFRTHWLPLINIWPRWLTLQYHILLRLHVFGIAKDQYSKVFADAFDPEDFDTYLNVPEFMVWSIEPAKKSNALKPWSASKPAEWTMESTHMWETLKLVLRLHSPTEVPQLFNSDGRF